jgi:hypothetical protein
MPRRLRRDRSSPPPLVAVGLNALNAFGPRASGVAGSPSGSHLSEAGTYLGVPAWPPVAGAGSSTMKALAAAAPRSRKAARAA